MRCLSNQMLHKNVWTRIRNILEIMHYDRAGRYIKSRFLQASSLILLTHHLCFIIGESHIAIGIFLLNNKCKQNQANWHYSHSAFPYLAPTDYSTILIARKKAVSEMCCSAHQTLRLARRMLNNIWYHNLLNRHFIYCSCGDQFDSGTQRTAAVVISLILGLREPDDKRMKSAVCQTCP